MRVRFVFLNGTQAGTVRDCDLADRGEVVLGRDPGCDVVVEREARVVSRHHAALRVDEKQAMPVLRDLDSTTGTYLDGEDIEAAEIQDGDVIELGRHGARLRIELHDAPTLVVRDAPAPRTRATPAEPMGPSGPLPLGARLRLTCISGTRAGAVFDLAGSVFKMGRAPGNAVWLPEDRVVSTQHAKIVRRRGGFVLLDLESRNGSFVNGHVTKRARLRHGDVITLAAGGPELRVEFVEPALDDHGSHATVLVPHFAELVRRRTTGVVVHEVTLDHPVTTLGRDVHADVRLDSPIVSKFHARLVRREDTLEVEDLHSANGTYVGDERVERAALAMGDRVVVGPFEIEILLGRIRVLDTRQRARLDAADVTVRRRGHVALSHVGLSLAPGTLTAVVGPSGAGASTLLATLAGMQKTSEGQIHINGVEVALHRDALREAVAFVPRDEDSHPGLTVAETLEFAARLRLPPDTTRTERHRRCESVMSALELADQAHSRIDGLTAGQRRRISIAMELLTEPGLLFLDDPGRGLDPADEEALMLVLRELSYKGKTLAFSAPSLAHLELCDRVVVLQEGRLLFEGTPDQLMTYFALSDPIDLASILRERPTRDWVESWKDEQTRRHVPAAVRAPVALSPLPPTSTTRPRALVRLHPLRQVALLVQRDLTTLQRTPGKAALLMAQAPLIAVLVGLSLLRGTADVGAAKPWDTLLLMLALMASWYGCAHAGHAVVRERGLVERERTFGLGSVPYVASKLVVLGGLCGVECLVSLAILMPWFGLPGSPLRLWVAMLGTGLLGLLVGLLASCLARSAQRVAVLLPLLIAPQALFTFPALQLDVRGPAGIVARSMPTWWAFDLLRRIAVAPDRSLGDGAIVAALERGERCLLTRRRLARMESAGYPMREYRDRIEVVWLSALPETLGARFPAALGEQRPLYVDAAVLLLYALLLTLGVTVALGARTSIEARAHDRSEEPS